MADFYDDWWEEEPMADQAQAATASYGFRSNISRATCRGNRSRSSGNRGEYGRHSSYQRGADSRLQVSKKKVITVPSSKVELITGKDGNKIKDLEYESSAKIRVGDCDETAATIIGTLEAISRTIDMINDLVREKSKKYGRSHQPASQGTDQSNEPEVDKKRFITTNADGVEVIDWDKLNAFHCQQQQERWSKLPPIIKDFYMEDPEIAALVPEPVKRWRQVNHDIQVKRDLRPIPNPVLTFEQAFQHYPEILKEIRKQDFKQPSPIQSQAWPILLRGDDMIGIAQTGTGKTLAFLLPALIHIDGQPTPREKREGPTVLILTPTQELALQIDKQVLKYQYRGIKSVCLYGGGDRHEQIKIVTKGVDIVIATPEHVNDLVSARHLNVINFSYIVLDEADRMLDMDFEPQIRKSLFDVRPDRQMVMMSATWPTGVRRLADLYMKNPIQVNVGSVDLAAVKTVNKDRTITLLTEGEKDALLFDFLSNMDPNDNVLVFCDKKKQWLPIFSLNHV